MVENINVGKKFYLENLGCSKNQVDAEIMINSLSNEGWTNVPDSDQAEMIIINTCGFIKAAKEESIDTAITFRKKYPGKKILLTGCFAQRYGASLLDKMPEIDGVFGNHNLQLIQDVAQSVYSGDRPAVIPLEGSSLPERHNLLSFPGSAYVKISEGCNHRCSYCAIPLIRGNLRSRTVKDIILEIKGLLASGILEINLIAQDLAALGTDRKEEDFLKLITEITKLPGKFWIRLLYIHPDFFPLELLDIVAKDNRILPYFDIPFQHASESVLAGMGRKGSSSDYLSLVEEIRKKIPQSVIRSTFMLGFPGETSINRKELLNFQARAKLDWVGVFIYSREEDTRAYSMRGSLFHCLAQLPVSRFKRKLEDSQTVITERQMERFIGLETDILIEENVKLESMALGRAYFHAAEVDGSVVVLTDKAVPGKFIKCKIIARNGIDLEAVPVSEL